MHEARISQPYGQSTGFAWSADPGRMLCGRELQGRAVALAFLLQTIPRRRRFAKACSFPAAALECCEASACEIGRASADHGQRIRSGRPVCHWETHTLSSFKKFVATPHQRQEYK